MIRQAAKDHVTRTPFAARVHDDLRALGVGEEDLVAVCDVGPDRLLDACAGILASGAALTMLDPDAPSASHRRDLARCRPAARVDGDQNGWIVTPLTGARRLSDALPVRLDAACYVAFTSGSSGPPQAAVVEDANVNTFLRGALAAYDLGRDDVRLFYANPAFDLAVEQLFTCLVTGARLSATRSPRSMVGVEPLFRAVGAEGVTVLSLPTGIFNALGTALVARPRPAPPSLRLVMTGGEAPVPEAVAGWAAASPDLALLNGYGPTETTVVTSLTPLHPGGPITIGHPFDGITHERVGEELVISGGSVARGYLPSDDVRGGFIAPGRYATGDRAFVDDDGCWRIEGRLDDQVKVGGFRVEPSGVASVLRADPAVVDAHVTLTPGGVLGALIVPTDDAPATPQLEERLAAVAASECSTASAPRAWLRVAAIPLTARGKRDERAARELLASTDHADGDENPGDPGDPAEAVRAAWTRCLGAGAANQRFVAAGGTSLSAIRLANLVDSATGVTVPPAAMFGMDLPELIAATTSDLASSHRVTGRGVVELASGRHGTPTWVFLPPLSGAVSRYVRLARLLPDGERVLACETDADTLALGFGRAARRLAARLVEHGLEGPVVVSGFSLGGVWARAVAVELSRQLPGPVACLPLDPPEPVGHVTSQADAWRIFLRVGLGISEDIEAEVGPRGLGTADAPDLTAVLTAGRRAGTLTAAMDVDAVRAIWLVYSRNATILADVGPDALTGAAVPTRVLQGDEAGRITTKGVRSDRSAPPAPLHPVPTRLAGSWAAALGPTAADRLDVDHFALLDPPHDAVVAEWLVTTSRRLLAGGH